MASGAHTVIFERVYFVKEARSSMEITSNRARASSLALRMEVQLEPVSTKACSSAEPARLEPASTKACSSARALDLSWTTTYSYSPPPDKVRNFLTSATCFVRCLFNASSQADPSLCNGFH